MSKTSPQPLPIRDSGDLARDRPDLFDLLFDPPWLGIPARVTASARALTPSGGFVEVFVSVVDGSIREAGFLTDSPPSASNPVMALASLWCGKARGLTPTQAARLEAPDILGGGMEPMDAAREAAETCLKAARAALVRAAAVPKGVEEDRPPEGPLEHKHATSRRAPQEAQALRDDRVPDRSASPAPPHGG